MSETPWRDEGTLRRLYHGEGLSQSEIGNRLGCSKTTVLRWMDKHGVEARDPHAWLASLPPQLTHDAAGYEMFQSAAGGESKSFRHHQLVAIAGGADPYDVFSDGTSQVHHTIPIPWLTYGKNLEVLGEVEHGREHATKVLDSTIIDAVCKLESPTTENIAESVGLERSRTWRRLDDLVRRGDIVASSEPSGAGWRRVWLVAVTEDWR